MRLFVDTHVMLWWLADDSRLSPRVLDAVEDGRNDLLWSVASSWEIAIKHGLGKLELDRPLARLYADLIGHQDLTVVPVDHDHCVLVAALPPRHSDPFDRMIIVQAQQARVPILTVDPKFQDYDVEVVW